MLTTRSFPAVIANAVIDLIPRHCRSVLLLHGETDDSPKRIEACQTEMRHVRRAIRIANREFETAELARRNDSR